MSNERPAEFPRAERIRQEFRRLGGAVSSRLLAEHLMAEGVFDAEWAEDAAMTTAQAEIRRALKEPDRAGLPFAMAIGRGALAVWRQRDFWSYPEYVQVIGDLSDGLRADYGQLRALHAECLTRFGRAPEVPTLDLPKSWTSETAD